MSPPPSAPVPEARGANEPVPEPAPGGPRVRLLAGLPLSIWALGAVSLLMDVSTEMIESLMPLFLVSVLGLGAVSVGLVSGLAEATASLARIGSGWLSDVIGRRKTLALIGYGIAMCAKPFFAPASGLAWVMATRFVDRIGKGIRVAPRDALLADLAPREKRGVAFGLRKALDSLGATLGPLIAFVLMAAFDGDIRLVYWLAVIPAVLCVVLLAVAVKEPPRHAKPAPEERPRLLKLGALGPGFGGFILLIGVMHLAIFSEAFMLLRGVEIGIAPALVPMLLVVMNLVYAAVAYLTGWLSDRREAKGRGRMPLLFAGFAPLIAAYLALAVSGEAWQVYLAAVLWGAHLGMTQGLMPAIVADLAPRGRRGTAFGAYHLVAGLAALPAGAIAGVLWQLQGHQATFLFGASLTALALSALALWHFRYRWS
ncbi:MAG: MFS transporter [Alphaproteobacteria bacterium]